MITPVPRAEDLTPAQRDTVEFLNVMGSHGSDHEDLQQFVPVGQTIEAFLASFPEGWLMPIGNDVALTPIARTAWEAHVSRTVN